MPSMLFAFLVVPQLRIAAPPELASVQKRLESIAPQRFDDIAQLVGLADAGPPIQVVLAPETAAVARKVPLWVAGFASSAESMVVLFPARTPRYPNGSLEDVLRHEVTHVLIGRASAERPIPRWFNEGLAMSAERGWRLEDEGQFVYQWPIGSQKTLADIDRMFEGEQSEQTRAYALSGAFVHDLLRRQGQSVGAHILTRMNDGASFDHAFTEEVGLTPESAESEFWNRQQMWTSWLPELTSSNILWLAITGLALVAIVRRLMRNRAIEKKWVEEGVGSDEPPPSEK